MSSAKVLSFIIGVCTLSFTSPAAALVAPKAVATTTPKALMSLEAKTGLAVCSVDGKTVGCGNFKKFLLADTMEECVGKSAVCWDKMDMRKETAATSSLSATTTPTAEAQIKELQHQVAVLIAILGKLLAK